MFWDEAYAQEAPPPAPVTGTTEQPAAGTTGQTPNPLTSMLPMVVIFIFVMYFLMIRPNQKREQERQRLLSSLAKGDKVVTSGGVIGTIVGLTEKTVVLRVNDENTKIEFARASVAQVTPKDSAES